MDFSHILHTMNHQLKSIILVAQANFPFTLSLLGGLWVIHVINFLAKYQLNNFGVIPRDNASFAGIIISPLLHADFNHLIYNTVPFFVLSNMVLIYGLDVFYHVTALVTLLSNMLVWLFGRKAIHIGASGLIMGYWAFLMTNVYLNFNVVTVILALVCLYYLGNLLVNVFPAGKESSWESHLFGLIAGFVASIFY